MIATTAASVTADPLRAVIIDDDAAIQQSIAETLMQLGIAVEAFESAKEAFAAIDRDHPGIIFLDVALLRSDAIDVLRGLGQRRYGGVVQLMSGGRPALLEAIQRIGVREGIRLGTPLGKPFTRQAIVQSIEALRATDNA